MSGHSKWSKIHRQKGLADQKRGQLFSKLSKMIAVAAREGTDPEGNFKLRLAIERARQANMPKGNIERAIQQVQGKLDGGQLEEAVYEGYGPEKVALIIEAVTDNRNRTTAEIKNFLEKRGGILAGPGAVAFQFKKRGLLTVKKNSSPEEKILAIMDLGVEDVEEAGDVIEIYTQPRELDEIRKKLEDKGLKVLQVEIVRQPTTLVSLANKEQARKVLAFMEELEDHDDVQKVFANLDVPDEILERIIR